MAIVDLEPHADALNRHDAARLRILLAPDGVYEDTTAYVRNESTGRSASSSRPSPRSSTATTWCL
jgi:hypothetical protein